jgi:hypothetical protein
VTVEEALLAVVGLVAIVLLFLGLTQALEGDPRARLRARRRRLSRRGPGRPTARARSVTVRAPQPAPSRREESSPVVEPVEPVLEMAEAAPEPEPAGAASAEDLDWRERVAGHIRRRELGEARGLIDRALASGEMTVGSAELLLEVCSTAIARDLWRLRRAARRGTGDEAPLGALMETTRVILESEPASALVADQRQQASRRLWRGHTRLGLRRWRSGDFEAAVETLSGALSVPGLDERRRRLACDLLVRTLEDAAGQSLELIPQLRGDGDRATAVEQAQRVLEHIRRAREEGIPAEDLAVAASRARQLLEHIDHTSVQ